MFTTVVDVAIGLIFVYLLLSLMCSAANEIIELILKKRAIDLERGIREMLAPGSKSGTRDIVQQLFDHGLINNLFGKRYNDSKIGSWIRYIWRTQLPSYIPARSFALALMDLVAKTPTVVVSPPLSISPLPSGATGSTPGGAKFDVTLNEPPPAPPAPGTIFNPLTPLRHAIASNDLLDVKVREGLIALVDAAGDDVAKARENIETWFNNSMDRVSSWYKRRTQVVILILALFVAVAANADSLAIAKKLSTDKALRESLVAASMEYAKTHASPTPTENSSQKPEAKTEQTGAGQPDATPSPSPENPAATSTPTPCPTPTPVQTKLPEACKDLTSEDCRKNLTKIIPECADPNSDGCKTKTTSLSDCVKDFGSQECKYARILVTIPECADKDSDECKTKTEYLSDCVKDAGSEECKYARILVTIPECIDRDSAACKEKALIASIPACNECKPGKDPKESPQCKYVFNQRQLEALNLPIGWGSIDDVQRKWPGSNFCGPGGWLDQLQWHVLGWLLTALAISLGAPFWFDLLNKFIVIRSAVKPHEKSPEEESKD